MRIDKYLWHVRFFKSRSLASKACNLGRVKIDGQALKPSREVHPTDIVDIRKNQIDYRIKILDIPKSRLGAKLVGLYMVDITPAENLQKLELLKHSSDYYRKKGLGRPTKKDRRDLEDFTDDIDED